MSCKYEEKKKKKKKEVLEILSLLYLKIIYHGFNERNSFAISLHFAFRSYLRLEDEDEEA